MRVCSVLYPTGVLIEWVYSTQNQGLQGLPRRQRGETGQAAGGSKTHFNFSKRVQYARGMVLGGSHTLLPKKVTTGVIKGAKTGHSGSFGISAIRTLFSSFHSPSLLEKEISYRPGWS